MTEQTEQRSEGYAKVDFDAVGAQWVAALAAYEAKIHELENAPELLRLREERDRCLEQVHARLDEANARAGSCVAYFGGKPLASLKSTRPRRTFKINLLQEAYPDLNLEDFYVDGAVTRRFKLLIGGTNEDQA